MELRNLNTVSRLFIAVTVYVLSFCPGLLCRSFLASLVFHRLNYYTGYYCVLHWLLLSLLVCVFLSLCCCSGVSSSLIEIVC
ncbi:hypothetical protein LDENG_00229250 [Lucifuga dentata]|nr:hypothetical protein LDENG_00229250 [Lucifuga dentata]